MLGGEHGYFREFLGDGVAEPVLAGAPVFRRGVDADEDDLALAADQLAEGPGAEGGRLVVVGGGVGQHLVGFHPGVDRHHRHAQLDGPLGGNAQGLGVVDGNQDAGRAAGGHVVEDIDLPGDVGGRNHALEADFLVAELLGRLLGAFPDGDPELRIGRLGDEHQCTIGVGRVLRGPA